MIGKTKDRTFTCRASLTESQLLGRLLRGLLLFAIVADVVVTSTASFAQTAGAAGVGPDGTRPPRADGAYIASPANLLYRSIGQLIGPIPCTGAFVLHPRIVLTAADCIMDRGGVARTSLVRPAYQDGADLETFKGRVVAVGSTRQLQSQSIQDASQDWAIILLAKRPPGIRPLDVAGYTPSELQSMPGRILLPSYPRALSHGQALNVNPSCSIEGIKWEVLLHDCAAGVGALGAPLLVRDRNCYSVVGVYTGSMLVEDFDTHNGHLQFAGRSAIGTWNFVDRLRATLISTDEGDEDAQVRSPDGCSPVTAKVSANLRLGRHYPWRRPGQANILEAPDHGFQDHSQDRG